MRSGSQPGRAAISACLPVLAAAMLIGCAASKKEPPSVAEEARAPMDRLLGRMVSKGELEKAQRTADSLMASKDPADREIAAYWKVVTWLCRDETDSALALLETNQGKWTGGLRKVHAALFLSLAREASQNRAAGRARQNEPARPIPPDKALQERIESLQKETGDLRVENSRLESEKEKYQKLLNDLETIR